MDDYRIMAASAAHRYLPPETLFIAHNIGPWRFTRVAYLCRLARSYWIILPKKLVHHIRLRRARACDLQVHTNEVTQASWPVYMHLRLYTYICNDIRR